MLTVDIYESLKDNYIYTIRKPGNDRQLVIVDPGEYKQLQAIKNTPVEDIAVLITHSHFDHVDGLKGLYQDYPSMKVYTSKEIFAEIAPKVGLPESTLEAVTPDGTFEVHGLHFNALSTPGHTKYGLTFITQDCMFVGDLLFCCGVGKVLDGGDLMELYISVDKVKSFAFGFAEANPNTPLLMFPAHEYALSNISFARALDDASINPRLDVLEAHIREGFAQGHGHTPVNFYDELAYNPFLRAVTAEEFARFRTLKDGFPTLAKLAEDYRQVIKASNKEAAAKIAAQAEALIK